MQHIKNVNIAGVVKFKQIINPILCSIEPEVKLNAYSEILKDEYSDSVVSLLKFNNNLNDETGRNHYQLFDKNFYQIKPSFNNGLEFHNAYLVSCSSDFNYWDGDFTLECFATLFEYNKENYAASGLFCNNLQNLSLSLRVNNVGKLQFWTDSCYYNTLSTETVSCNEKHHFAYVKHNNTFSGYVDGKLFCSVKTTPGIIPQSKLVSSPTSEIIQIIGSERKHTWNGIIHSVRISKIARYLTDFEPLEFN